MKHKDHSIKIEKYIAPKVMTVNGYPSPCECTDHITCAYCVQASLLVLEDKIKANDETINNILSAIKRHGIRKTAREMRVQPNAVQHWIKSENIPTWVIRKYEGVYNG